MVDKFFLYPTESKRQKEMTYTIQSIRNELRRLGNSEIAAHSKRYFKTGKGEYGQGDRFLGIRVPVLRKLVKEYKGISIPQASELLTSPFHEERLFSLLMLVDMYKRVNERDKKVIYDLYLGNTKWINNWDLVDTSAEHIVGPYLLAHSRNPLYKLARSIDLWERRISIMSTFHFIKHNEFTDTLKLAEMLLTDKEDLIHKAVGWMLREVGKRDMALEEAFLKRYYRIMPRTMLRYAIEKFPEKKRKAYLLAGKNR